MIVGGRINPGAGIFVTIIGHSLVSDLWDTVRCDGEIHRSSLSHILGSLGRLGSRRVDLVALGDPLESTKGLDWRCG